MQASFPPDFKDSTVIRLFLCVAVVVVSLLTGCLPAPVQSERHKTPYLARRAAHATNLDKKGPAPQAWDRERPPAPVREITYTSGDLNLKAWLYVPRGPRVFKHPALVYFHGGFAFGASDLADCQAFIDAGYVVMTPMLAGRKWESRKL